MVTVPINDLAEVVKGWDGGCVGFCFWGGERGGGKVKEEEKACELDKGRMFCFVRLVGWQVGLSDGGGKRVCGRRHGRGGVCGVVLAVDLDREDLDLVGDVGKYAGQPMVVDHLRALWQRQEAELDLRTKADLTAAVFPYPLDDFQIKAIEAFNRGESAVVSAPTGIHRLSFFWSIAVMLQGKPVAF